MNRDLLPVYLNDAKYGDTMATRHLLALFCEDLKSGASVDAGLVAHIHQVLSSIVALKDARDTARSGGEGGSGDDAKHYRAIAQAMGLVEPRGRPSAREKHLDLAIETNEQMQAGESLEVAAATVEERHPGSGNVVNIYSANRKAARADFAMRKLDEHDQGADTPGIIPLIFR
jgi:hypothetical protein